MLAFEFLVLTAARSAVARLVTQREVRAGQHVTAAEPHPHVVPNKVEAAYARSDLFECQRRLMDDRTAYLNSALGSSRYVGDAMPDGMIRRIDACAAQPLPPVYR